MKPYYYVYRYGDKAPRIRHITLRSARDEAIRLSERHPGAQFEILKLEGLATATKASMFWADGITPQEIKHEQP